MMLSNEQKAYFRAKARVEATKAISDEMMSGESMDWESDADIEAYCGKEIEAEDKSGYTAARDALRDAENAMMDWALEQVKTKCAGKPGLDLVIEMHEKMKRNVVIRHQVVDLAATLRA